MPKSTPVLTRSQSENIAATSARRSLTPETGYQSNTTQGQSQPTYVGLFSSDTNRDNKKPVGHRIVLTQKVPDPNLTGKTKQSALKRKGHQDDVPNRHIWIPGDAPPPHYAPPSPKRHKHVTADKRKLLDALKKPLCEQPDYLKTRSQWAAAQPNAQEQWHAFRRLVWHQDWEGLTQFLTNNHFTEEGAYLAFLQKHQAKILEVVLDQLNYTISRHARLCDHQADAEQDEFSLGFFEYLLDHAPTHLQHTVLRQHHFSPLIDLIKNRLRHDGRWLTKFIPGLKTTKLGFLITVDPEGIKQMIDHPSLPDLSFAFRTMHERLVKAGKIRQNRAATPQATSPTDDEDALTQVEETSEDNYEEWSGVVPQLTRS